MGHLFDIAASNAVVFVVLAPVLILLGKCWHRPALMHTLWVLLLLKLLVPPSIVLSPPLFAVAKINLRPEIHAPHVEEEELHRAVPVASTQVAACPVSTAAASSRVVLRDSLVTASLCVSCLYVLLVVVRRRRFHTLLRFSETAPSELLQTADRLCDSLGLRARADIRVVRIKVGPMVCGFRRRPVILLPRQLFSQLNEEAGELILAHELAHVQRGDHWIRGLELAVSILYWWHPLVWWARRQLRQWEELCCDEIVVRARPEASRVYATALLDTVEFLAGSRSVLPALATGAASTRCLKRRIEMLLSTPSFTPLSPFVRYSAILVALAILPLGATVAQGDTQLGQPPVDTPKVDAPQFDVLIDRSAEPKQERGKPVSISFTFEDGSTQEVDISRHSHVTIDISGQRLFMHSGAHAPQIVAAPKLAHPPQPTSPPADVSRPLPPQPPLPQSVQFSFAPPLVTAVPTRTTIAQEPLPAESAFVARDVQVELEIKKPEREEPGDGAADDRLDRLERMILELQQELKSLRAEHTDVDE